ncbi:hypothetical protein J433_00820 [Corynebacterium glutamicum MT]|uniref:TRAP transporter small permease protein n=1 Tax=Corynebacterium glutamicum TaxID=1718 RepID=A0AB36ICZ8_CORGT|nr:TRAP transporter small permease [Corynebacterium glutamicum]AGN17752.1 hypothetical protein C624_00805 [Corynebacterium glutamicum SCgG1]AGN20775.1 hypothetical protein C629_00805 [Corynebacterium glutamicum SCgG2]EGV39948.1 hypothetical protein CgS9114_10897 [Corynebacterium glutamicum S9114]EOA65991.1 hypothetical protein J433_00820 [Corynebacterium glutamicum MT]EPP42058.1 TRAP-T family transporter, DctQ (4 TMs) subunit [Corynebacterium glutamicum Z188]
MLPTTTAQKPAIKAVSKISRGGSAFLMFFSGAALAILVLLVTYDVILRNFFGSAMNGVSEYVSEWLMPATILFGLAYAEHKNEHIRVTIVEDAIKGAPRKMLRILGQLTAVLISGVIAWSSLQLAIDAFGVKETVPMGTALLAVWPIKIAVVAGWVWMAVQSCASLINIVFDAEVETHPEPGSLSELELEDDPRA